MSPKVSAEYTRTRRSEILDAATVVFSEKGFSAATLDEVAARAGVSKGSIYNYFDSKEDVIDALNDQWGTADDELFRSAGERDSSVAGLNEMWSGILGRMSGRGAKNAIRLGVFLWAEALINSRVERSQAALSSEWRERTKALIEAAQAEGELDQSIDSQSLTVLIGAMGFGLYIHRAWGVDFDRDAMAGLVESLLGSLSSERV